MHGHSGYGTVHKITECVRLDHSGTSGPASLLMQGHPSVDGTGLRPDGAGMSPGRGTPCPLWTICSSACSYAAQDSYEQKNELVCCAPTQMCRHPVPVQGIFLCPSACRTDSGLLWLIWIDPMWTFKWHLRRLKSSCWGKALQMV